MNPRVEKFLEDSPRMTEYYRYHGDEATFGESMEEYAFWAQVFRGLLDQFFPQVTCDLCGGTGKMWPL